MFKYSLVHLSIDLCSRYHQRDYFSTIFLSFDVTLTVCFPDHEHMRRQDEKMGRLNIKQSQLA